LSEEASGACTAERIPAKLNTGDPASATRLLREIIINVPESLPVNQKTDFNYEIFYPKK